MRLQKEKEEKERIHNEAKERQKNQLIKESKAQTAINSRIGTEDEDERYNSIHGRDSSMGLMKQSRDSPDKF